MIATKEQIEEFEKVTRPVIKWLNDNCHPHVGVVIDCGSAELHEGFCRITTEDYIKD
jgi:protein involved in ribonucleotide reduction